MIEPASVAAFIWLLAAGATPAKSPAAAERTNPFAGHNCYSDLGVSASKRRLASALKAGLRFIEVDVNHHRDAGGFVVTHKSKEPPSEPLLVDFLEPLWRQWRDEPGEHLLIIDFKAGRPDLVAKAMHEYLTKHRDVLCTFAPDGSPRQSGPISVCLTGSQTLGQAYVRLATAKGELLARRDTGPRGRGRDALRRLLQRPAPPGVAYLTLNWHTVVAGPKASTDYFDWLCEIVAGAGKCNYKLRVYTLNVKKPRPTPGRLVSGEWDADWANCVRAGVDMIATDNYALASKWWEQIGSKLEPRRVSSPTEPARPRAGHDSDGNPPHICNRPEEIDRIRRTSFPSPPPRPDPTSRTR